MRKLFDLEGTDLLNSNSIDYTASPYKLKDCFKLHCGVFIDIDSGSIDTFDPKTIHKIPKYAKDITHIVGHNIINYDLLALKLYYGMDYSVNPDSWMGQDCKIEDTLVISKTLNPDRYFGHSLGDWGRHLKFEKIDWRAKAIELGLIDRLAPRGAEFKVYHPAMLDYCVRDAEVNLAVLKSLQEEMGDWDWRDALELEHSTIEINTRQEHRGFWFHEEKAKEHVIELDKRMGLIVDKVEPLIPPKPLTKAQEKEYSFSAQVFKKDGDLHSNFVKWVDKVDAKVIRNEENRVVAIKWMDKRYDRKSIPLEESKKDDPFHPFHIGTVIDVLPATLKDGTHIKEWLVGLGWNPSVFKDKDITVNSKKVKKTKEKYDKSVQLYINQTLKSNFKKFRYEALGVCTESEFRKKLYEHDMRKPLKVLTNPQFSVDQEKTICPHLRSVEKEFPYIKEVIEWLTYNHRRNSILGGGVRFDEGEVADKGFLSVDRIREDNRLPTSADTMGASSGRFRHRLVANIPRSTSLFGKEMRELFGCQPDMYQLGADFVSVEAMVEGHYCMRYKGGEQYSVALTAEKPNDLHSSNSRKLDISRPDAKTLKYSCLPVSNTEVLTKEGWKFYPNLSVGDEILSYNIDKGVVEGDVILNTIEKRDTVYKLHNKHEEIYCTKDHKWVTFRKFDRYSPDRKVSLTQVEDFNTQTNILLAAPFYGESDVTPEEASVVGWLLSDGHYSWSKKSLNLFTKDRHVNFAIDQADISYPDTVREVLSAANLDWSEYRKEYLPNRFSTEFKIPSKQARNFLDRVVNSRLDKHDVNWVKWVINLSEESRETFLYHFWLGDGVVKNRSFFAGTQEFHQNRGNIADAVALNSFLQGRRTSISGEKLCRILRRPEQHITCANLKQESIGSKEVFCLTTNNSTFIIRQGDFIGITGNCTYGAQPAKIAKQMGWTMARARQVFNGFWQAASPLKDLKESLTHYWKTTGQRKFILGLDGRKVPTRSEHSLLNNLFQSAGAITFKRQMIMLDSKLREEGLLCDFFKDDWKTMIFVQQMQAYHDEEQLEMHKSLVNFKMFNTEEEAEAYRANGFMLSNVGHTEKGYYRAYSKVGAWMNELAGEASRYYDMKVTLKMDYAIGKNWENCH